MKVLPALTAAFLFAASTQTSQAMPCEQYGQLVENSMNDPAILPMQKQCYVGIAEYTCEECNGNMACMQSRGQIGPKESARIMSKLPECSELMQLARGFMPKRRLRSQAMPEKVSCDVTSVGRLVDAQLPPVTDPAQVIVQGMQKRCFVGITMDMCEPCDGDTACIIQTGGQQDTAALMQSTPECEEFMQLASGFMPKRRLRSALNRLKRKTNLNKSLLNAVQNGQMRKVKRLLSEGADVNGYVKVEGTDDKKTPLLVAINDLPRGDVKVAMVKLLLKSGANPNKVSSEYRHSPLLLTVWYANVGTAKLLLDHQANPNLESYTGTTPLTLAITNGMDGHALLFLQDPRTRVNRANKNGQTPLGRAYCNGGVDYRIAHFIALVRKYGGTRCAGCSRCP